MADKVYGTSKGRPVDESEIGHLVAEAEDGYDTDALRRRGGRRPMGSGPADVVPVRLDPELKAQVTGGSTSTKSSFLPLREAGATARALLVKTAAEIWGVDV